ncbi:MAG TPA: DUF192 domain-containing protein [Candidatus Krumholzibacteriaceae bacterium]|nr:DUF192 domain-containing protein [Candidatus Krumholzibacteriaceae bacterium]
MSVLNLTQNTILGDTLLTLASNFNKTLKRINNYGIPKGCALWLHRCSGIYTVGMKNPVDIIFIDKNRRIIRILRNFPPGCFTESADGAIGAIELPPDTLSETHSNQGDLIELFPG